MTVKQLRPILHIVLLIPFVYYSYQLLFGDLGADPAEELNKALGTLTIRLLILNLLWGILIQITSFSAFRKFSILRRPLGVWTFIYALLHVTFYFIKENDRAIAISQIFDKFYLNLGALSLIILTLLALTSNDFSVRKLKFKNWKNLHRLGYVALYLSIFHYGLIEKADPRWAFAYMVPITLLYLFRVIQSKTSSRLAKRPSS